MIPEECGGNPVIHPKLINEIECGEAILPAVKDSEWETEVRARLGACPELMSRVSRSHWLQKACLNWEKLTVKCVKSAKSGLIIRGESL